MKKKEYLKILNDSFKDFQFFEEDHHYEYKGERVGISVTKFYEQYCNEFNAQEIAEKVANNNFKKYNEAESKIKHFPCNDENAWAYEYELEECFQILKLPITVTDVLNEWQAKNDWSCLKGHLGHLYAQNLWSGISALEEQENLLKEQKIALKMIFKQADNFYNDFKDKLEHLADEFVIGSKEYDIASAIDHLFVDKQTGGLVLVDYKTNTDIHKNEKYAKNMKVPLNHLKDIKIVHYYIQLSIYKYLVEKYTGLKIENMFIVWFSEDIENYEIIEIPYLEEEVKRILENRRERIMGKCIPVLIIGHSGAGKSTSLRNLKKEDYSLVNPLAKRLPFKNDVKGLESSDYEQIKAFIEKTPKDIVVIDDSNYLLTMEMMKKAKETGYNKFTDMASNYWKLNDFIKNLDGDKRVYLMSHEEIDDNGFVGVKTVGKMLTNQCCIEGLYTIVLRAESENGKFCFRTHTTGNDIIKSPMGMFESDTIDNDLAIVDKAICEYYGIEDKNDDDSTNNSEVE